MPEAHVYIVGDLHEKPATLPENSARAMAARSYLAGRFERAVIYRGVDVVTDLEEALVGGSVSDRMVWKRYIRMST